MTKAYSEELVYTDTADGLTLEGVVIRPTTAAQRPIPVIWIHGPDRAVLRQILDPDRPRSGGRGVHVHQRQQSRARFRRPDSAPGRGCACLAGGGWERFDESPHDVDAWITLATSLGYERVVLIGHSLGALKVAYYQARRQDPRVAGLVAASAALPAAAPIRRWWNWPSGWWPRARGRTCCRGAVHEQGLALTAPPRF